jgi:hypothetical protein
MENVSKKSDLVNARRSANFLAVQEFVEGMTKKLTRVEISRGVDELLGRAGDGVSWNDTGVAIAQLIKAGVLQETKEEGKKRTFYTKVAAQ